MTAKIDFEPIFQMLVNERVEFMVIGGYAELFYGSTRVTFDVDLCYRRTKENFERLAEVLKQLNARLRGAPADLPFRIDARTLELGDNFTFETDYGPLDLLGYVEPLGTYDELAPRAELAEFKSAQVMVISLDDLITIKRHLKRDKDRDSLNHLTAIKADRETQISGRASPESQDRADLITSFEAAMMQIYKRARTEANYNAIRFLQMLHEHGGLGTARMLLASESVAEGYTALWERSRLDLTMEALIIERPEFHALFTQTEIDVARRRLTQYGYER